MIFFKRILNRKGGALVLIMTMCAALAIILPVGYMIVQSSMTRQAERATRERYTQMVITLKTILESPFACPDILKDMIIPEKPGDIQDIELNWKFDNSTDNVKGGWKSPNMRTLQINKVYMKRTGPEFDSIRYRIAGATKTYKTVPIRIYLQPNRLGVNLSDSDSAPIRSPETYHGMKRNDLMIRLWANVDSQRKIFSCFGADSPGAICEARGGAFNITSTTATYCQPDKICFASVEGLKDNATSCATVPYPYKAKSVGVINGKLKYLCSVCFDDLP